MSFDYEPLTEEQCEKAKQFALLDPGVYNFKVFGAEEKLSASGNSMIQLKVSVWDNKGKEYTLYDYLVVTPNMMWKTLHFCKAVGLEKEYDNKTFNEILCLNKSGKASIVYQAGKKKPDGTFYKDKNSIEDYISAEGLAELPNTIQLKDSFFDNDVPF